MQRLKSALVREYEENSEDIKVYNPRNTVGVDFYFTGEKTAKVYLIFFYPYFIIIQQYLHKFYYIKYVMFR